MDKRERRGKSSPVGVLVVVAAIAIMNAVSDGISRGGLAVAAVLLLGLVTVLFVMGVKKAKQKKARDVHTHDRIDQRKDIKINPKTGKTEARRVVAQHTPKEHWKQQLDGLLANGTIDKEEYRKLINRRF